MTKKYTIKKLTIGVLSVGLALTGLSGVVSNQQASADNVIEAKTNMQDVTVSVAEVDGKAVATVKATKDVKNVEVLMTIDGVTKTHKVGDLKANVEKTIVEDLVKSEVVGKGLPKTNAAKEVTQLVNKQEVAEGVLSGHTVKVIVKYQVEELVKVEDTAVKTTDTAKPSVETSKDSGKVDAYQPKGEGFPVPSKPETGGTYSPKDVIKPENIDKPTPKDDVKPLPPTIEDLELPKPKPEQPKTDDTVKPETGDTVKPEGEKPSKEVTPERTPVYGDADYNWQPTYKNLDKNEPFELYAKYDLLEFNKSVVKYINQYAKPEEKLASGAIEPATLLTDLPSEAANEEEARSVLHNYSFRAYELARQVGSTMVKGEAHVRPEGPDNKMIAGENTLEMTDISRPGTGNDFRGVEDKLAHMVVVAWDQSSGHRASMEMADLFMSAFDYNPYTGRIIVTLGM